MVVTVRRFEATEWQLYKALRLSALSDSPDAFATTLAMSQHIPDSEWQRRLAQVKQDEALPLVAFVADEPVGLAWGMVDAADRRRVHLYQMWVSPDARGTGVGRRLMEAFIEWACGRYEVAELGVTCGNSSARHLYASFGFQPMGEPEPLRGGSELRTQNMARRLG